MPRIAPQTGAWILEWLELQALNGKMNVDRCGNESRVTSRHEMRHGPPHPHVTMQPEATIHGVQHAILAPLEFLPRRHVRPPRLRQHYWQPINPSTVAGVAAGTLP